jgi:hypothetical protein
MSERDNIQELRCRFCGGRLEREEDRVQPKGQIGYAFYRCNDCNMGNVVRTKNEPIGNAG